MIQRHVDLVISIIDEISNTINGLNLYMYCMNNPVMYADPSGHMPKWLSTTLKILGGVAIVAGLATIFFVTGGSSAPLIVSVVHSMVYGALLCSLVSGGSSIAIGWKSGKDFNQIVDDTFSSIVQGAIVGAISGGFSRLQFNLKTYEAGKFLANYFSQTSIQSVISILDSTINGASKEELALSLILAFVGSSLGVKDGSKMTKLGEILLDIGLSISEIGINIMNNI